MVARSGGLGAKEGRNQSRGQKRVSEWSEEGESVRQLSLSHPPATRNTADWWLSHWISELKAAKNSSQEALAPTRLGSVGPLSAQLLLFSPGSL